jgi:hypothetical protein
MIQSNSCLTEWTNAIINRLIGNIQSNIIVIRIMRRAAHKSEMAKVASIEFASFIFQKSAIPRLLCQICNKYAIAL